MSHSADYDAGLRGTVADAMDFARECAQAWGTRVRLRVEERRDTLPPIIERRAHVDGPLWDIRPTHVTPPATTEADS